VTVVGRLSDVQPWGDPGHDVIHDMTLTVTVRLADLVITSAEAGMGTFPHAECPFIAPAFAQLEGLDPTLHSARTLFPLCIPAGHFRAC